MTLAFATANSQSGTSMEVAGGRVTFVATEEAPLKAAQLVFSSLPHGASATWVARARDAGAARGGSLERPANRKWRGVEGNPVRTHGTSTRPGAIGACRRESWLLSDRGLDGPASVARTAARRAGCDHLGFRRERRDRAGLSLRLDLLFGEVTENFRAYGAGTRTGT